MPRISFFDIKGFIYWSRNHLDVSFKYKVREAFFIAPFSVRLYLWGGSRIIKMEELLKTKKKETTRFNKKV